MNNFLIKLLYIYMKKNIEKLLLFFGMLVFVIGIGAMLYWIAKPVDSEKTDYEKIIDSLNRENAVLDSLYDEEKEKKNKTRILYKKISIQEEIDSLNQLKTDLNALKLPSPRLSDTINPDSLRVILMKEFN